MTYVVFWVVAVTIRPSIYCAKEMDASDERAVMYFVDIWFGRDVIGLDQSFVSCKNMIELLFQLSIILMYAVSAFSFVLTPLQLKDMIDEIEGE